MIRVAFPYPRNPAGWIGGLNYLRNLVTALASTPEAGVEPVLLMPGGATRAGDFPPVSQVGGRLLTMDAWLAAHGLWHHLRFDPLLAAMMRRLDVAVLSHAQVAGRLPGTPMIGWIPDFQHRHLPDLFSAQELAGRDQAFERMCRFSARVVVSSEAALRDLTEFHPRWAHKARVLRFVDCSTPLSTVIAREELERRHGFSGPYLLVPNQFWAHKNHRIVIEALGLLARSGRRPLVIATGHTEDYRRAGFFGELMARRAELRVEDEFRVLGTVPYPELAALMRHASAIVNPSLFEGWSTTVEEAKTLGKRVLLSDIPVHREQAPARGVFFDPREPESLAESLWAAWTRPSAKEEAEARADAEAQLEVRRRDFALTYAAVVQEIVPAERAANGRSSAHAV